MAGGKVEDVDENISQLIGACSDSLPRDIGPHLSILCENGHRSEHRIGRTTGHTCDL